MEALRSPTRSSSLLPLLAVVGFAEEGSPRRSFSSSSIAELQQHQRQAPRRSRCSLLSRSLQISPSSGSTSPCSASRDISNQSSCYAKQVSSCLPDSTRSSPDLQLDTEAQQRACIFQEAMLLEEGNTSSSSDEPAGSLPIAIPAREARKPFRIPVNNYA